MAMATASPAPKRTRMTPDERRQQIIASARQVFLERGYSATVRHIAEQAGITEPFVYQFFGSKQELYELAVEEPLNSLLQRLATETSHFAGGDNADRVAMLEHYHENVLRLMLEVVPLLAVTLFSESGTRFYSDVVFPAFSRATTPLAAVMDRKVDEATLQTLVDGLFGMHFGIAMESIFDKKTINVKTYARQLAVICGPTPPGQKRSVKARKLRSTAGARRKDTVGVRRAVESVNAGPELETVDPRRRLRGPERRALILEAAREVFLANGLSGARTSEIAKRAGITEAFMFRVFNSKEELYVEAVERPLEERVQRLEQDVEALVDQGLRGADLFRAVNRLWVEMMGESNRLISRLMNGAHFSEVHRGRPFYRRAELPVFKRVTAVMATAAGWDGLIDPDVARRALIGAHYGAAMDAAVRGRDFDSTVVADQLALLFTLRQV